jgi:hypothetical protein
LAYGAREMRTAFFIGSACVPVPVRYVGVAAQHAVSIPVAPLRSSLLGESCCSPRLPWLNRLPSERVSCGQRLTGYCDSLRVFAQGFPLFPPQYLTERNIVLDWNGRGRNPFGSLLEPQCLTRLTSWRATTVRIHCIGRLRRNSSAFRRMCRTANP